MLNDVNQFFLNLILPRTHKLYSTLFGHLNFEPGESDNGRFGDLCHEQRGQNLFYFLSGWLKSYFTLINVERGNLVIPV